METWEIKGPTKLSGEVKTHGNKNSTFPCIAASLLLDSPDQTIILENIPRIKDVFALCDIIKYLGIDSTWIDEHTLRLSQNRSGQNGQSVDTVSIPPEVMAKIRGSIVLLGPLIGKYKKLSLPKPGGDKIGSRPLTAHTLAFRDLGFMIEEKDGALRIDPQNDLGLNSRERKDKIWLTERSVTATLSLILFSRFLEKGKEISIYGAACEPHVNTLCSLISQMGAEISGGMSNFIKISWPNGFKPLDKPFRLDDDHIEATTYAVAATITKNDLFIKFNNPENLELIDRYLNWMGVSTKLDHNAKKWSIFGSRSNLEINSEFKIIKAEPWPGLPTDIMSLLVVLATQCKGTMKFIEYMYDDRFTFVQTLKDMGAQIEENPPHVIKVTGPSPLFGQEAFIRPDIRSGAGLVLAALCAKGTTVLHDKNNVIERGYEKLPETLISLGANIKSE